METLDFIRAQPPFDSLSEAELEKVVKDIALAKFKPNSYVLTRSGSPSQYLYLVRQGAVRLEREGKIVQVLEEGESFGYASLLSQNRPVFDVVTDEETEVYQIPGEVIRQLIELPAFAEFFLRGVSERLRRSTTVETSPLAGDMTTPVKALIIRPPLFISPAASVAEAGQAMRRAWVSSALITGDSPGIITDRDLRNRVLAEGLGSEIPVRQVMSRPLKSLPADTPVYGALLFMLQENIHHLPLTQHGDIIGVITGTDLLRHQVKSPLYLMKRVEMSPNLASLEQYSLEVAGTVETLFQGGLDVTQIGRMIASLNDILVKKILTLAEKELGPPPTPYAWIVFGSEGRLEQTLLTDQDNAIVYRDDSDQAQAYFKNLAERVVNTLIRAGFPSCPGGYMATTWRYPLGKWQGLFKKWVHTPEPQALLEAAIFFDFRRVHGELKLDSLEEIFLWAGKRELFLAHLAQLSLGFKPPLSFFRRIKEEEGGINLKKGGITPIVSLARLFALQAGSPARSTVARLAAIDQAGILSQEKSGLLAEAFHFISHVRLREQLRSYHAGQPPSNHIHLESLSSLERRHLKDAFLVIRETQELTAQGFQTGRLG